MTIRIRKGPGNGSSPLIRFLGISSEGTSSVSQFNLITNVSAQINAFDANSVDILNLELTSQNNGTAVFELEEVSFGEWRDEDNNTFSSAVEVVQYVDGLVAEASDKLNRYSSQPVGVASVFSAARNTPISFKFMVDNAVAYYWNEGDFPAGLTVSPYDQRILQGSIAFPGNYSIQCEVANIVGVTTDFVQLNIT